MCSLSATLRYCCMGPAPFDDIGDIPYHEGKTDGGAAGTLRSLEAPPYLPRLLSPPASAYTTGAVHSSAASNPDPCCLSSEEEEEESSRECGGSDRRRMVTSSAVLNGSSFGADGKYQQTKRSGPSQGDQSQKSRYTIHHAESQGDDDVLYSGRDVNNHSNHRLKAPPSPSPRRGEVFHPGRERGFDNICVSSSQEPARHRPRGVSSGQQRSRRLVSASSSSPSSCQSDSKVGGTDPCLKTVGGQSGQGSQTRRKSSRSCCGHQHHALVSRMTVPSPSSAAHCSAVSFRSIPPLPASPLAFHRHAWEEKE